MRGWTLDKCMYVLFLSVLRGTGSPSRPPTTFNKLVQLSVPGLYLSMFVLQDVRKS